MSEPIPQLTAGCGYTGHDFGAPYPDSECFGGRLYDMDNCDEEGNLYEPGDYIPCPDCCHEEWRDTFKEQIEMDGWIAAEKGKPESDCPFPAAAKRYPQDGEWLKEHWLLGHRDYFKIKAVN